MVLPSKVAIRTLALEREELIAQGRKVVCPDNRLICDAIPLMFARTLVEDFGWNIFSANKNLAKVQEKDQKLTKSTLTKQFFLDTKFIFNNFKTKIISY